MDVSDDLLAIRLPITPVTEISSPSLKDAQNQLLIPEKDPNALTPQRLPFTELSSSMILKNKLKKNGTNLVHSQSDKENIDIAITEFEHLTIKPKRLFDTLPDYDGNIKFHFILSSSFI